MAGTVFLIVVLLLAAMVLTVVEICTPIFGLLAAGAIGCAAWAVYLAWTLDGLFGMILLIACLVGAPVYVVAAVKLLPKTPLVRRLHLGRDKAEAGEGTPEAQSLARLVGRTTIAETVLRPSGTIRVDGRRLVAQAESVMIQKGSEVRIIQAAGNRVIVRQIEK